MILDQTSLAIALVDELEALEALEALGACFSFLLNSQEEIALTWSFIPGRRQIPAMPYILRLGMVNTAFGDAFRDAVENRYVADRLRVDGGQHDRSLLLYR